MRKRFVDAITGYYRKWQEKSEGERLVLVIQYLTVLTMVLGLIRSLFFAQMTGLRVRLLIIKKERPRRSPYKSP